MASWLRIPANRTECKSRDAATVELTFTEEFIHTRHGVVPLRDSPIAAVVAALTGMVDLGRVRAFCEAAGQRFHPEKIILFGSYAYGKPTADSDVDLLVIMPRTRERGQRMSVRIRHAIPRDFPLDLLVRTPADVAKRLRWGDGFMQEVIQKGKVMYEAGNA